MGYGNVMRCACGPSETNAAFPPLLAANTASLTAQHTNANHTNVIHDRSSIHTRTRCFP
jgi:hypothetical protein